MFPLLIRQARRPGQTRQPRHRVPGPCMCSKTKKDSASAMFHPFFARLERPLLIAHRGCSGLFPENTILAFQKALEFGADMLELDVHLSSDNELIVCHDRSPTRTTNFNEQDVTWDQLSLAQIKELDAGYLFQDPTNPTPFPFRGQDIRIPTFREVLTQFPDVLINIDMKYHEPKIAKILFDVLSEHNARERVIVCSLNESILDEYRKIDPSTATGAAPKEVLGFYTLDKLFMGGLHKPRSNVYEVPIPSFIKRVSGWGFGTNLDSPAFIKKAHSLGQKVFHWTANDADTIKKLVQNGSNGVMTDRVDIGLEAFKELGLK